MQFSRFPRSLSPILRVLACAVLASVASSQDVVVLDVQRLGEGSGFMGPLVDRDYFGSAATGLGDIDGDGIVDLAIGADADFTQVGDSGSLWLLTMNADGSAKTEFKIGDGVGGISLSSGARFGSAVTCLGDLDGDGIQELAVGAQEDLDRTSLDSTGSVWILFFQPDGSLRSSVLIATGLGGLTDTLAHQDEFGSAVAGLGDVDGDGIPDLAVGSEGATTAGGFRAGSVRILFLNADGTVRASKEISSGLSGFPVHLSSNGNLGSSLTALDDFDGDGIRELAVGNMGYDSKTGAFWVLRLDATGSVKSAQMIASGIGGLEDELDAFSEFGEALEFLGDVDQDGLLEIAVGSPGRAQSSGGFWILSLGPNDQVQASQRVSGGSGGFGLSLPPISTLGSALALVGDLNGDGRDTLFVGADNWTTATSPFTQTGTGFVMTLCNVDLDADFSASTTQGPQPLAVQFTDLSSGSDVASWSWDFGDGSSSSQQSPSTIYYRPGTFTVTLLVSDAEGACIQSAKSDIVVELVPTSVTERNGTAVNPSILSSSVLPVLGTTWVATVDATPSGASGLVFLFGFDRPLDGLITGFGEVLVDPTSNSALFQVSIVAAGSATFNTPVPNDLALEGLMIFTQGFLNGDGQLTNALDLVLGL